MEPETAARALEAAWEWVKANPDLTVGAAAGLRGVYRIARKYLSSEKEKEEGVPSREEGPRRRGRHYRERPPERQAPLPEEKQKEAPPSGTPRRDGKQHRRRREGPPGEKERRAEKDHAPDRGQQKGRRGIETVAAEKAMRRFWGQQRETAEAKESSSQPAREERAEADARSAGGPAGATGGTGGGGPADFDRAAREESAREDMGSSAPLRDRLGEAYGGEPEREYGQDAIRKARRYDRLAEEQKELLGRWGGALTALTDRLREKGSRRFDLEAALGEGHDLSEPEQKALKEDLKRNAEIRKEMEAMPPPFILKARASYAQSAIKREAAKPGASPRQELRRRAAFAQKARREGRQPGLGAFGSGQAERLLSDAKAVLTRDRERRKIEEKISRFEREKQAAEKQSRQAERPVGEAVIKSQKLARLYEELPYMPSPEATKANMREAQWALNKAGGPGTFARGLLASGQFTTEEAIRAFKLGEASRKNPEVACGRQVCTEKGGAELCLC